MPEINHPQEAAALSGLMRDGGSRLLAAANEVRALDPAMSQRSAPVQPNSQGGSPPASVPATSVPAEPLSPSPQGQEPTPQQETATPSTPSLPRSLRIKVGDREEEVPVDELGGLIERARKVNERELNVREQSAQAFVNWADDPRTPDEVKRYVLEAIRTGKVPQFSADDDSDGDDGDDSDAKEPQDKAAKHLEQRLNFLEQQEAHRLHLLQKQQRDGQVEGLLGRHDVFRDDGVRDLARSAILNQLDARPDLDPKAVVQQAAAQYGTWVTRIRQSAVADARPSAGARTAPVVQTGATPPAEQKFTGKDLEAGQLLNRMMDRVHELKSR